MSAPANSLGLAVNSWPHELDYGSVFWNSRNILPATPDEAAEELIERLLAQRVKFEYVIII